MASLWLRRDPLLHGGWISARNCACVVVMHIRITRSAGVKSAMQLSACAAPMQAFISRCSARSANHGINHPNYEEISEWPLEQSGKGFFSWVEQNYPLSSIRRSKTKRFIFIFSTNDPMRA